MPRSPVAADAHLERSSEATTASRLAEVAPQKRPRSGDEHANPTAQQATPTPPAPPPSAEAEQLRIASFVKDQQHNKAVRDFQRRLKTATAATDLAWGPNRQQGGWLQGAQPRRKRQRWLAT